MLFHLDIEEPIESNCEKPTTGLSPQRLRGVSMGALQIMVSNEFHWRCTTGDRAHHLPSSPSFGTGENDVLSVGFRYWIGFVSDASIRTFCAMARTSRSLGGSGASRSPRESRLCVRDV